MRGLFYLGVLLPAVLAARTQLAISLTLKDQSSYPVSADEIDSHGKYAPLDNPVNITILPSTKQELISHVRRDFLDRFPNNIVPTSFVGDVANQRVRHIRQYHETNVELPDLETCTPRISNFVQLAQGIVCGGHMERCRFVHIINIRQSYSTAMGMSASSTVTAGFSGRVFSAEASFTIGSSWEESWTSEEGRGSEYHFDLLPGTSCIPGMIHVELDCRARKDLYWWDTWWEEERRGGHLRLEYYLNRHERSQPYGEEDRQGWTGRQYCTQDMVTDRFWLSNVYEPRLWKQIDPIDNYRGFAYLGNPANLNAVRDTSAGNQWWWKGNFRADEMIVHRGVDIPHNTMSRNRIWRCLPARRNWDVQRNMTIPLRGAGGTLQGYVACV